MHLTSNELALVSSIVAMLAIIGGYLGVKSANKNVLQVARAERSFKLETELLGLKRMAYAKFAVACFQLMNASSDYHHAEQAVYEQTAPGPGLDKANEEFRDARSNWDKVTVLAREAESEIQLIAPHQVAILASVAVHYAWQTGIPGAFADAIKYRAQAVYAMRCDVNGDKIPAPEELERMAAEEMKGLGPLFDDFDEQR